MLKILDLFSGTQSVRKALDLMNIKYEYYGIDIYSPEEPNLILDLSLDNIVEELLKVLPKDWVPNFIWASPVCSKFSVACAAKGGNVYFEFDGTSIKPRENIDVLKDNPTYKNYTLEKIQGDAILHLKLVENMQQIINYYNVDFVIENPRTSHISKVLNPLYVPNYVDYCMYGFDYKKPTTIYSNYNLGLKRCNHNGKHKVNFQNDIHDYAEKAKVPPLLIKEIIEKFNKI